MISRYDAYKDSGVEWIGKIPEHWEIKPLYSVCSQSKLKNESKSNNVLSLSYGKIVKRDVDSNFGLLPESFDSYQVIHEGYTVLRLTDLQNDKRSLRVGYCGETGIITSAYISLRPLNHSANGYFLYLYLHSADIKKVFYTLGGGLRQTLRFEELRGFEIPLPPISEQTQIVSFLDEKTAHIDTLISVKQRKIELLKEKRTALINQAVTKGLNPNAKMKDSGIEWIGEIPEHWEISRFKYDSTSPVKYGLNISSDSYKEEGIRFIRITDIAESGVLICDNGVFLEKKDVPKEFLLKKNDVLFCRSGHTVGKSYLHQEDGEYTSGGYLVRFNFQNSVEARFIFLLGKTKFYWDWIKLNSVVSTIENVNGDKFQNFQYARPPFQEQAQIVTYLDEKTKEIDDLLNIEQKKIDLLREYRQSLISEVVTGKIRVYENNLIQQQTLENG